MKTTTRIIAVLGAAAALSFPLTTADAAQQLPPQCSIEREGPLTVKGQCPTGFYWVTAKCQDRFTGDPAWVRHTWGDASVHREMTSSCTWREVLRGGEVFNATTGEKVSIAL